MFCILHPEKNVCVCNRVQPGPPQEGFVMESRTQGIQEILKIYRCPDPYKSELGGWDTGGWSRAIESYFTYQ